ncbi:MAG: Pseudouridine synthase, partial [Gammaproteobacteria bacterium]|nr:Pseudouridine synthase [Gammaproteobacteria bacterium]
KEGRNRVVRKLWESQGVKVSRLIRIRFGSLTLPRSLRRGRWMELEKDAVTELLNNSK